MRCFEAMQELYQGKGKEGRRLSQLVFTKRRKLQLFQRGSVKARRSILLFNRQSSLPCVHPAQSAQVVRNSNAQGTQWRCRSVCTAAYVLSSLMLACSFNSAPVVWCWVMLIFASWLPGVNSIANNLFSCCLMQSQQKRQHLISHCSLLLFWEAIWLNQLTSQRISTPLARFFWGFMDPLK